MKERPEDQHQPLRAIDPGVSVEGGAAIPQPGNLAVPSLVGRERHVEERQAEEDRGGRRRPAGERWGPPCPRPDRATWLLAAAAFAVALGAQILTFGLSLTPDRYVLVLLAPALVLGCGRRLMIDFVPFVLLIVLYEEARGIAHIVRPVPYVDLHLDVEQWLFRGNVPSNVLQDWLWQGHLRWWDQVLSAITRIHFIVPPTLAFALWLRRRALYYRFAATMLVLSYAGALTFALYPAAPPWYAADELGKIPYLANPSGVQAAQAPLPTSGGPLYQLVDGNQFAAIPSLHGGYSFLIFLFAATLAWNTRWRWPVTAIAILYPVSQSFAAVYTGNHYVVDLLIGVAYAAAALFGVRWLWRRVGWPE
jgi:membrane-associated phospholipid phosphatase